MPVGVGVKGLGLLLEADRNKGMENRREAEEKREGEMLRWMRGWKTFLRAGSRTQRQQGWGHKV